MLTANMENISYKFANPDSTGCLDSHNTTHSPSEHHNTDMSQEDHEDHHSTKASTHTEATYGLQHHLT